MLMPIHQATSLVWIWQAHGPEVPDLLNTAAPQKQKKGNPPPRYYQRPRPPNTKRNLDPRENSSRRTDRRRVFFNDNLRDVWCNRQNQEELGPRPLLLETLDSIAWTMVNTTFFLCTQHGKYTFFFCIYHGKCICVNHGKYKNEMCICHGKRILRKPW